MEAAEKLLKPPPKDVPPQLLLALEKDGRCLARGYEAARALSEGILQSMRDHRDSYKVERNRKEGIWFTSLEGDAEKFENLFLGCSNN